MFANLPFALTSRTQVPNRLHYTKAPTYVRWQRKQRADRRKLGPLICAALVESHRVDGAPRQKTVAYLGGIREGYIESALGRHLKFWRDVTQRLDQLGDGLTVEEREKVETALAKRVRRPTDAESAKLDESLASLGLMKCA